MCCNAFGEFINDMVEILFSGDMFVLWQFQPKQIMRRNASSGDVTKVKAFPMNHQQSPSDMHLASKCLAGWATSLD